jgi:hypothetical protein
MLSLNGLDQGLIVEDETRLGFSFKFQLDKLTLEAGSDRIDLPVVPNGATGRHFAGVELLGEKPYTLCASKSLWL